MRVPPDIPGFRSDLRRLAVFALPVAGVQVGLMLMGVVDTLLVGRVSPVALAAVALGNFYFLAVGMFGMGVLFALDPLVAQGIGAGDEGQVTLAVQRAMLIAAGLTVVSALLCLPAEPVLRLCGQPEEIVPVAGAFVHASIPGLLPFFAFIVFRQTLQAMQRMRPIVLTIAAANVVNTVLCATLVFGLAGAPRLGAVGAAWASTASRWFMACGLLVVAWRELAPRLVPLRRGLLDARALGRTLAIGLPIGTQFALEVGVFTVVGLMMGRFGTVPVAAHQVALNLASFTFMVPLGVAGAASVLVGNAVGRGDPAAARRASIAALAAGVGFMGLTSAAFVLASGPLAALYTPDPGVRRLAATLIPIAGVFQVFDGTQVVSIGALRGLGDTRAPVWINVLGFWLLGFPVSLTFGFALDLGPRGLWWGLVVGLVAVALLLLARLRQRLRGAIRRLHVER